MVEMHTMESQIWSWGPVAQHMNTGRKSVAAAETSTHMSKLGTRLR